MITLVSGFETFFSFLRQERGPSAQNDAAIHVSFIAGLYNCTIVSITVLLSSNFVYLFNMTVSEMRIFFIPVFSREIDATVLLL